MSESSQNIMEIFSVRLKSETISELREISKDRHLPLRTMVRAWILERLDLEKRDDNNG